MIKDSYEIITEILGSLRQELSDIDAQIHCNLLYIKEEDICINKLKDKETDELKMFYPRIDDDLQKDEIEKATIRKTEYEKLNKNLYEKRDALENRIGQLKKVIEQEDQRTVDLHYQEEERNRISGELHDTALQNLVHLIHKIELCGLYIDEDPLKAKLELSLINKGLKEVVNEIRNIIFDLRPMTFDDLGLKAGFERLLDNINEEKKYEIFSDIDDVSCENSMNLLYIYRAVQESLNNIVKHAEAEKIWFRCKSTDDVCIIDIEDDGKGFYEEKDEIKEDKHFGLSLMRERIELLNGIIDISSLEGNGTKIHMEIPLKN